MTRIELVYFKGCPGVQKAQDVLRAMGVAEVIEVDQGTLAPDDPRRDFSSPSLLLNGELVAGTRSLQPSCSLMGWDLALLRAQLGNA